MGNPLCVDYAKIEKILLFQLLTLMTRRTGMMITMKMTIMWKTSGTERERSLALKIKLAEKIYRAKKGRKAFRRIERVWQCNGSIVEYK